MARIAFFMYPQEGHLFPTFRLARSLQEQGHQIMYLGLLDFEAFIQAQGFQFVPIFTDSFPRGTRERQALASFNQEAYLKSLGGLRSRLARTGFIRRQYGLDRAIVGQRFQQVFCHVLLNQDDIHTLVQGLAPDLLIIDTFLPAAVLMAYQLGLRCISLNVTANLHGTQAMSIPPPTSTLLPGQGFFSPVKTRLTWWARLWGRTVMFWLIKYDFDEKIRKMALLCGYPIKNIENTIFYPHIKPDQQHPEFLTFPKDFDFPQARRNDACYIESMDLQRKEVNFPWERIARDLPLLYCALGSRSHTYAQARKFYQTIIDALASRQDWQAVIAIGDRLHSDDFPAVPPNVLLVNWAPQLEMLQRSSVMITHAGLGTVKECIYCGVPMIAFPVTGDHPGNAARIVYHGLGVMGSFRNVSVPQVLSLLTTIEKDPSFKDRVEAMAKKLREVETSDTGAQMVNAFLASAPQERA